MLFSEITGHNKIKDILIRSANAERVSHAYLFEGPSGVGKLSMARAFAMRLICENPVEDDSCGKCPSCSRYESQNHPDICEVTNQFYDPGRKSTDILVDTIRKMKSDVYIKPFLASRKVYIIPKADTMNLYAQNSLLKVLEEPPEYCTIILLAENSNSFLPTILSRATQLKFYPLSDTEVEGYLLQNFGNFEVEKISLAAKMCGGSIKKARELLESCELQQLREELLNCFFALFEGRRKTIYDFSLFLRQNKDEIDFLMNVIREILRDILYIGQTDDHKKIKNIDKTVRLKKLSEHIKPRNALRMLEILLKYDDYFSKNIGYGIISQCLSLELWEVINDRGYRSKIQ